MKEPSRNLQKEQSIRCKVQLEHSQISQKDTSRDLRDGGVKTRWRLSNEGRNWLGQVGAGGGGQNRSGRGGVKSGCTADSAQNKPSWWKTQASRSLLNDLGSPWGSGWCEERAWSDELHQPNASLLLLPYFTLSQLPWLTQRKKKNPQIQQSHPMVPFWVTNSDILNHARGIYMKMSCFIFKYISNYVISKSYMVIAGNEENANEENEETRISLKYTTCIYVLLI